MLSGAAADAATQDGPDEPARHAAAPDQRLTDSAALEQRLSNRVSQREAAAFQ